MAAKPEVEPLRESSLELEEALPVQRWVWRLEWVLLAFIVVIMAGSLAGLFGGGWLSETHATDGDLAVSYERFVRVDLTTIIETTQSARAIAIDADYFASFKLERVVPMPDAQRAAGDELVFEFDTDGTPYTVRFYLTPSNPLGNTITTIRAGERSVRASQFTFP